MKYNLLIVCAMAVVQAILNPGEKRKDRLDICQSDICSCKSDSQILVTCSCLGSQTQEFELSGVYTLHTNTQVFKAENCLKVTIPADILSPLLHIRQLKFENIRELVLNENSFRYKLPVNNPHPVNINPPVIVPQEIDGIVVTIANSSIPNVPSYTFQGRLTKITLDNVDVEKISSFAFTDLYGTKSLELIDVKVSTFEPQSFKKFTVDSLTLKGGNYTSIPSLTMKDITVLESFIIQNITVGQLSSSAFILESPFESSVLAVLGSRFTRVEGEALKISTCGPMSIENNVFISLGAGAFLGITVQDRCFAEKHQKQKLYYKNNNLTHFYANSLAFNTSRVSPIVVKVVINQWCKCDFLSLWSDQLSSDQTSEIFCLLQDKGSAIVNVQEYNDDNCGIITSNMHVWLVIIVSVSLLLLVIGVVVICICLRRRSRHRRWTNVPESDNGHKKLSKTSKVQAPDSRITMVVPDGRTYRETELHVIVEQTEPISDQHIYQNVQYKGKQPVPLPRTTLT